MSRESIDVSKESVLVAAVFVVSKVTQKILFVACIAAFGLITCKASFADSLNYVNCSANAERQFANYVEENQKPRPKVAQFFSQKMLASLVNSIFLNEQNVKMLTKLSIGKGTVVTNKKTICTNQSCRMDVGMQGVNGVKLHMLYDYVSENGSCEDMLIDHQTIVIDCEHRSNCK